MGIRTMASYTAMLIFLTYTIAADIRTLEHGTNSPAQRTDRKTSRHIIIRIDAKMA
jgi:hypothetical protein